jgi:hypothetical protein
MAHYKLRGRGGEIFPALKVPSQCPLSLLFKVRLREGKALGSETGKVLGCGLYSEQRSEVVRNYSMNIGRAACGSMQCNHDRIGRSHRQSCLQSSCSCQ